MNEPFYHYLRNAELVFQNGSRITIYGDQLTEWRVTPDGARGKSGVCGRVYAEGYFRP